MIAASIVTASTAATVAASRRAAEACGRILTDYDAVSPTVGQMQAYAACVQRMYPADPGVNPLWLKVLVASLLLSMAVGALKPMAGMGRDWESRLICGLMYPALLAVLLGAVLLVALGGHFLIS